VAYDSPNYLWFRQRYPRFVYVDRVVVARAMRGRGYARLLYAGLFNQARRAGHEIVGVDIVAQAEHWAPREQLESRAGS